MIELRHDGSGSGFFMVVEYMRRTPSRPGGWLLELRTIGCNARELPLFGVRNSRRRVRMALTTTVTRVAITDDSPMALSIEWKLHANILLGDVERIQDHIHSSG